MSYVLYRKDGKTWYKTGFKGSRERVTHFGALHLYHGIKIMIKPLHSN